MPKAKYLMSEAQVKRALKIDSFRNLSKDKVIEFVSLIPRMDKEVAIAIINQFPVYTEYAINVVSQLNVMCDSILKSNEDSERETIEAYKTILASLAEILKRSDIAEEERQRITEQMIGVADRIADINADNRKFLEKIYKYGVTGLVGVLILGATILGVNFKGSSVPELNDENLDSEDINDEE